MRFMRNPQLMHIFNKSVEILDKSHALLKKQILINPMRAVSNIITEKNLIASKKVTCHHYTKTFCAVNKSFKFVHLTPQGLYVTILKSFRERGLTCGYVVL